MRKIIFIFLIFLICGCATIPNTLPTAFCLIATQNNKNSDLFIENQEFQQMNDVWWIRNPEALSIFIGASSINNFQSSPAFSSFIRSNSINYWIGFKVNHKVSEQSTKTYLHLEYLPSSPE